MSTFVKYFINELGLEAYTKIERSATPQRIIEERVKGDIQEKCIGFANAEGVFLRDGSSESWFFISDLKESKICNHKTEDISKEKATFIFYQLISKTATVKLPALEGQKYIIFEPDPEDAVKRPEYINIKKRREASIIRILAHLFPFQRNYSGDSAFLKYWHQGRFSICSLYQALKNLSNHSYFPADISPVVYELLGTMDYAVLEGNNLYFEDDPLACWYPNTGDLLGPGFVTSANGGNYEAVAFLTTPINVFDTKDYPRVYLRHENIDNWLEIFDRDDIMNTWVPHDELFNIKPLYVLFKRLQ